MHRYLVFYNYAIGIFYILVTRYFGETAFAGENNVTTKTLGV